MSWSYHAIGKPKAVAAAIREEMKIGRCSEPEESFRQTALDLAARQCETGFDNTHVVKVVASGSQYRKDGAPMTNTLKLEVDPVYSFIE